VNFEPADNNTPPAQLDIDQGEKKKNPKSSNYHSQANPIQFKTRTILFRKEGREDNFHNLCLPYQHPIRSIQKKRYKKTPHSKNHYSHSILLYPIIYYTTPAI
jgi:hypothetical protein